MATDKQVLQWFRQGGTNPPENLYWFAEINESNEATKIMVVDELFNNVYTANPSDYPNMKPADESTQIGDSL